MNAFDTAAILIAIAALTAYINHRVLKLSPTTGTLAVALVSSLVIVAADIAVPAWGLRRIARVRWGARALRGRGCGDVDGDRHLRPEGAMSLVNGGRDPETDLFAGLRG